MDSRDGCGDERAACGRTGLVVSSANVLSVLAYERMRIAFGVRKNQFIYSSLLPGHWRCVRQRADGELPAGRTARHCADRAAIRRLGIRANFGQASPTGGDFA